MAGRSLIPLHGHLTRFHDHIALRAAVLDHIAQDRDVLFAIGCDTVPFSGAPPSYGLDPVAALGGAKSVFRELVEFYPMAEEFMQFFVDVEGTPAQPVHRRIGAEHFDIKPVAIERDDMCEGLKLRNEFLHVRLKPAPELILLIPCDSDGYAEPGDVRPSTLYFVRQTQRFNVQIDFAIE